MRIDPRLLPLALCLALAGAIAAELAPPPAPPPPAAGAVAKPVADMAARRRDWVGESLRRPLFSPDRRPAAGAAQAAGAANGPFRLSGILMSPEGRRAIFGVGAGSVAVEEGGTLGGYRVRSIAPGRVTLAGPDGVRVLRPSFDPAGVGGGAGAVRPVGFAPPPPVRPAAPRRLLPPQAAHPGTIP